MDLYNDRKINICIGESRKSVNWKPQSLMLSELYDRLSNPVQSPETMEAYLQMSKGEQDALKDVGGFVGGTLNSPRRKADTVTGRDVLTLDLDHIPAGQTEAVIKKVNSMGAGFCVYSTRKHRPDAPRLRIVIPLNRTATPDEYEACARKVAAVWIGIEMCDPTTFEPSRLMYWGSHCSDGQWVFCVEDGAFLSVDGVLALYQDWHDISSWPTVPGAKEPKKLASRQADPLTKDSLVGVFCRAYNVLQAMDAFLPGVYEPAGEDGRYTFTGGSTTGGAVTYDDDKFLFSYHATDPCSGQLVNAWDLVRLHKFGHLDDGAAAGAKGNTLPSYQAMSEFVRQDSAVIEQMAKETFSAISTAVEAAGATTIDQDAGIDLAKHKKEPLSEKVLDLALQVWGISVRVNDITGRGEVKGLPPQYLQAAALNVLPTFLSDVLKPLEIKGASPTAITDYLQLILARSHYNPVVEMLDTVTWDGVGRLPVLLNILGVDPGSIQATLIQKWLIQCIAMARNTYGSGNGADGVLTLQGPQGIGKTMFFRRLAVKPDWFAEGVVLDVKDKDSKLQATSAWISELGEVDETLRKEQSWLKGFITSAEDRIRAPYARAAEPRPRRTSFCATVNPEGFLWDTSGNRRFWTITVTDIKRASLQDLPETWFIQLWAEVNTWWVANPQSFRLTREEQTKLAEINESHRRRLVGEEEIMDLLDFSLPINEWEDFTASEILRKLQFSQPVRLTAVQVGKALQSVSQRYEGVEFRTLHGRTLYRLPIRRTLDAVPSAGAG